ncbi:MAG TPA: hypothetical protein VGF80_12310 [Galbitalea sp.]|jgi:hypothetical protein|nr:hypothetical protein [Galbitalea sp.]
MNSIGFARRLDEKSHNEEDEMMKTHFATARVSAGVGTVGLAVALRPRR